MGLEIAFQCMEETGNKYGFERTNIDLYMNLINCTRGFGVESRGALMYNDITWMKREKVLRRLEDVEKMILKQPISTLINTKSCVSVIDDKLIVSRENDVETKKVSNHKSRKEGLFNDCVACSFTSFPLGFCLKVKGESQEENVEDLISTLPSITHGNVNTRLKFDRDYGKWHLSKPTPTHHRKIGLNTKHLYSSS